MRGLVRQAAFMAAAARTAATDICEWQIRARVAQQDGDVWAAPGYGLDDWARSTRRRTPSRVGICLSWRWPLFFAIAADMSARAGRACSASNKQWPALR